MNRNTIITLSLAASALLFTGCKKYLKESSQDELTPSTAASLNELLAREGYPYVATASNASDGYSLCNYLNTMDDDAFLQNIDVNPVAYMKPFYGWSETVYNDVAQVPLAAGSKNPYQSFYNRIRGCNTVMDMLPDVSGSAEEKDQMQGEALALRAYYYFMLVNLYARPYNDPANDKSTTPGVPLIDRGGISDKAVARSPVKEVYDFIAADIEKAISLLEKKRTISTLYRINYRTAWLLASRIYLHMEQWDKVLVYSGKLINEYPLLTDLNTWKTPIAQASLAAGNANFIDPTNVEMLFLFTGVRYGDLGLMTTGGLNYASLIASPELINSYETNDMRYAAYTGSTNLPANFFLTRLSGYYSQSKVYYNAAASRCFRMSEAYVNRAEANIRTAIKGGDASLLQKALDDLNYLRLKRFKVGAANATVTPASFSNDPQQVLQFCLAERRREFCFEEFRWFDLRRNGMPQLVHTFNPNKSGQPQTLPLESYTLPQGGNRYVMKIPDNALTANALLVQNP